MTYRPRTFRDMFFFVAAESISRLVEGVHGNGNGLFGPFQISELHLHSSCWICSFNLRRFKILIFKCLHLFVERFLSCKRYLLSIPSWNSKNEWSNISPKKVTPPAACLGKKSSFSWPTKICQKMFETTHQRRPRHPCTRGDRWYLDPPKHQTSAGTWDV